MIFSKRMVRSMILSVICGSLLAGPLLVSSIHGQETPATRPARNAAMAGGGSLASDMGAMGTAWGKLKAQLKDPTKNDSSLTLLNQFETAALAAKSVLPPNIARMPEADRKKAAEDYHGMLRSIIRQSLDMEEQLVAGDNEKAQATYTAITAIEQAGHAEFRGRGARPGRG